MPHWKSAAGRRLRSVAVAAGLCWSVLFVAVGLHYRLQTYADGSIFSYSVAVQDAWAFHWHNIAGRLFVYLFCFVPAETYVWLTGDAAGGVAAYGLLFFAGPLLGLLATYAADRSPGRIVFTYACASTACLCPLVFGFPTEMWMAHALFWPALALCHDAPRSRTGALLIFAVLVALLLTHGGALVFAAAILFTVTLRGLGDPALLRAALAMLAALAVWLAVKLQWPPDNYFASVLPAAAWNFVDVTILASRVSMLLIGALAGYALILAALSRISARAEIYAAAAVAAGLSIYWLRLDHALLAENRYYLRTALLVATPAFGLAAAAQALHVQGRLVFVLPQRLSAAASLAPALTGALMLVALVHAVETSKFISAWSDYQSAVRALATGTVSDPNLGDARFVSSGRIEPRLEALGWSSTTQYLSVLLAPGFAPKRLVVDPSEDYFWLSCETATANRIAPRAVPAQSRDLVGVHACLHRQRRIAANPPPAK